MYRTARVVMWKSLIPTTESGVDEEMVGEEWRKFGSSLPRHALPHEFPGF